MLPSEGADKMSAIGPFKPYELSKGGSMTQTSHDGLVIRHIRLCGCGKPAGHNSVCAPGRQSPGLDPDNIERISQQAEAVIAERASGRFDRRKREFDSERRQHRAHMSSLELHRWIVEHAVRLSTVAAGNIEPSPRDSTTGTPPPPRQQTLEDDPRYRENMTVIRKRLEFTADLIDEAEGHSTVASTTGMLSDEKDKLICARENEGLRAQAVVDRLGSHIAGSARTVQRIRQREHLDSLGYPKDEPKSESI